MNIDVYTSAGTKKGTVTLPSSVFEAPIRPGLVHQAVMRVQRSRRHPIAHAKRRSEVAGSTKKAYQQKHTGRARRGSVRSPLLRGGGKSFGPRSDQNFTRDMPRAMRRQALLSSLSMQAKEGAIVGLESYPDAVKTKDAHAMLKKLPVTLGRMILVVTPTANKALILSTRNIPKVRTIAASYLNPEDVLGAHRIVFLVDALKVTEETFARKNARLERIPEESSGEQVKKSKITKKPKKVSSPKA